MTDEKIYTPEVITDQPFPVEDGSVSQTVSEPSANGTYSPATIQPKPVPVKRIAHELFAESLNTKNRRILAEFQFTESGALQIGKYENGISGDIRITPNGITARDMTGATTFAIDAETGNATFRGTVQAAGFDIIDESGIVSLSNFTTDSVTSNSVTSSFATSYIDLAGAVLQTPNLSRPVYAIILFTVQGSIYPDTYPGSGIIKFVVNINGVDDESMFLGISSDVTAGSERDGTQLFTSTMHRIILLNEGINTIKIRWSVQEYVGTAMHGNVFRRTLSYLLLGS